MPKIAKTPDMTAAALSDLHTRIKGLKAELVPVSTLTPYARNSRAHTPVQIAQIVASFKEFGVLAPLIVDEAYTVLAGHARLQAALSLSLTHIPCIRLTGLTAAQKKAYVIADNRIALNSSWDTELLHTELKALQAMNFGLPVLGFSQTELDDALAAYTLPLPDAGQAPTPEQQQPQVETCTCPNCKSVFPKQK